MFHKYIFFLYIFLTYIFKKIKRPSQVFVSPSCRCQNCKVWKNRGMIPNPQRICARCVFRQRRRAQRDDLGSRMPNEPSSTLRATIGILRRGGPTKHQARENDESRSGFELIAKRESTADVHRGIKHAVGRHAADGDAIRCDSLAALDGISEWPPLPRDSFDARHRQEFRNRKLAKFQVLQTKLI